MESFNKNLKAYEAYQNKIKENIVLVQKLIELKDDYEDTRIFLLPNSIEELLIADTTLTYCVDSVAIIESCTNGTINENVTEDNNAIQLFIYMINHFKKNIDTPIKMNDMNAKQKAKLMIDYYTGFASDQKKFLEIIAEKTGFDIMDELSLLQFELYFKKAQSFINKQKIRESELLANKDLSRKFVDACTIFHKMAIEKLHTEPKVSADFARRLKKM